MWVVRNVFELTRKRNYKIIDWVHWFGRRVKAGNNIFATTVTQVMPHNFDITEL